MIKPKRKVLTLPKTPPEPEDNRPIDLDVVDLLLPCRLFSVTHKVAEVGRVSLTTEFLLRLLFAVDGLDEKDMAAFFGFDRREAAFILAEAESYDYVDRRGGRLWLTVAGRRLFQSGDGEPRIYEVEQRTDRIGFDLIALAPERPGRLNAFEWALPEMSVPDRAVVSSAKALVPGAFRKFYTEIATRRDPEALERRSLYSIDDVAPGDRFSSVVRVTIRSSAVRPSSAEPDLSAWYTGHDLDDRSAVVGAVAAFIEGLSLNTRPDDAWAYQMLIEFAPEFLKEFTRRDGLALKRFYKETITRVGEFRSNRPTVPIIGSLFTQGNNKRLFEGLDYGLSRQQRRSTRLCLWMPPQRSWGVTSVLPATLDYLAQKISGGVGQDEEPFRSIAAVAGKPPRHIAKAFDDCVRRAEWVDVPPALETMVVPGILAAALVHAPIRATIGVPVPIGFISFDEKVGNRVWEYINSKLSQPVSEVYANPGE